MKKSLQSIEDFYLAHGYHGSALRNALARDNQYKKFVKERRDKLNKQFKVTQLEKKNYLLSLDSDYEILAKCKQLERLKLMPADRKKVQLIKAQLGYEWRESLIKTLNALIRQY